MKKKTAGVNASVKYFLVSVSIKFPRLLLYGHLRLNFVIHFKNYLSLKKPNLQK